MRKIQAIGNVTRDAEVRHLQGGTSAINFDLACNERWVKDGVKQERVHYIRCTMWRETTTIAQYILKGVKLFVEGTPEVDAYVKDGKAVGTVKINVRELEFLSSAKKPESQSSAAAPVSSNDSGMPEPMDDLPF